MNIPNIYNYIYIDILYLIGIKIAHKFLILSSFGPMIDLHFLISINSDTGFGLIWSNKYKHHASLVNRRFKSY